jgi:glycosyltransferase involved in cell wall biosynthesis
MPGVPPSAGRTRPIRLVILDDNPFIRRPDGGVCPRAALFHRFAEAVVAAGPFEPAAYLVPVRDATARQVPRLPPVDGTRLHVVPTAPFDGIEGYLRHAPGLARRNWPVIRDTIADADLAWIKAPASNALLAALACRRAGVPRFTWVAGSARDVVHGQEIGGLRGVAAGIVAAGYDGVTRGLERSGPAIRLDASLFTSVISREEVETTRRRARQAPTRPSAASSPSIRLAWAGRLASEKGLRDLLEALAALGRDGPTLDLVGDGPDRPSLEARVNALGLESRVRWRGVIADRAAYLDVLRDADLFVLPSRAEGVPKVLVEAMAAGLPVVAARVGAVARILDDGRRGRLVPPGDPAALAAAIADLSTDPAERARLREAGLAFAAEHTAEAQAARLVAWMRARFADLPWPPGDEVP